MMEVQATEGDTMKVTVSVTLDIDTAAWILDYGTAADASTLRRDIKEKIRSDIVENERSLGHLKEA